MWKLTQAYGSRTIGSLATPGERQTIASSSSEGSIRRTREGGSEWETIKILLEGDGDSDKTNTTSNTRLRLTTQVGQAHVATGVLLDLGTNQKTFRAKTHHTTRFSPYCNRKPLGNTKKFCCIRGYYGTETVIWL
jgi:hypothetical protein